MNPQLIIEVFVDGACSGNPGPGGWAYCIHARTASNSQLVKTKQDAGGTSMTTNNVMELRAALEGLKAFTQPATLTVISDSQYLVKGMTTWVAAWERSNWKTSKKKPVEHRELWQQLLEAAQPHTITWHWIEGHSEGSYYADMNNLVNDLAVEQRDFAAANAID